MANEYQAKNQREAHTSTKIRYKARYYDGRVKLKESEVVAPFHSPMGMNDVLLSLVDVGVSIGGYDTSDTGLIPVQATEEEFRPFVLYVCKTSRFSVISMITR